MYHFNWQHNWRYCFYTMNSHDILSIEFKRLRFPIKLGLGMTINKAQCQTLGVAGIDLTTQCFSHGQLLNKISLFLHLIRQKLSLSYIFFKFIFYVYNIYIIKHIKILQVV